MASSVNSWRNTMKITIGVQSVLVVITEEFSLRGYDGSKTIRLKKGDRIRFDEVAQEEIRDDSPKRRILEHSYALLREPLNESGIYIRFNSKKNMLWKLVIDHKDNSDSEVIICDTLSLVELILEGFIGSSS